MQKADCLIIGAGIVGLTMARELLQRGAENIVIIEKEPEIGLHASGRNSGVLHAGIYYPPDTLKAKLCLRGNLLLQDYCAANNLPLIKTGKVIVAKNEAEIPAVETLYERAKTNGAKVELIDERQLAEIEPFARTTSKALFSHYTAITSNKSVLDCLYDELIQSKHARVLFNTRLLAISGERIAKTSGGDIAFDYFINAAGAYADKVAHQFDIGKEFVLIPFKGIYKKVVSEHANIVNGNIYPVPNLDNPFLGVHFTKNISGDAYVGPTAIPAFGRENYGLFKGMDREAVGILFNEAKLYFLNKQFRQVAHAEPWKYISSYFYNDAKKLVKNLQPNWLIPTAKVGIRPQLVNMNTNQLEMDFVVKQDKHSLHILNAISPAFTSSMAFATYLVDEYILKQPQKVCVSQN